MYCSNCGAPLEEDDLFCKKCGARRPENYNIGSPSETDSSWQAQPIKHGNSQQVYYQQNYTESNFEPPAPVNNPRHMQSSEKTRTEKAIQGLTIACIVVSVVLAMLAAAMIISDNVVRGVFSDGMEIYYPEEVSSTIVTTPDFEEAQSTATTADDEYYVTTVTTALPTTASTTSSTRVTTTTIARNMQASYLREKIAGKWQTDLPYKTMKVPAVFTFDSKGKCSCVIKALFITKKFEGSYEVADGGACSITLIGLEDYVGGTNTMSGNVKLLSDNKFEFVSGDTKWVLTRAK